MDRFNGAIAATFRWNVDAEFLARPALRRVLVFTCPRCQRDALLYHGKPLADGALVCRWCFTDDDRHDLLWCGRTGGAGRAGPRPISSAIPEPATGDG